MPARRICLNVRHHLKHFRPCRQQVINLFSLSCVSSADSLAGEALVADRTPRELFMRKIHSIILAVMMVPITATASAQAAGGSPQAQRMLKMLDQKFADADTDHDGKLTLAEAEAGMPRVAAHFKDIDSAGLGYVTRDQVKAYIAAQSGH
jgi:hypothetical protein